MRLHRGFVHAQIVWLGLTDMLALVASVCAGVFLRRLIGPPFLPLMDEPFSEFVMGHLDGWIYFCGSIIMVNYVVGAYGIQVAVSRFNLLVNWLFSLMTALLVLSFTSYAWFEMLVGRGVLAIAIVVYALLSFVIKTLLFGRILRSEVFVCRTVILGTGLSAEWAKLILERSYVIPRHKVCAYLDTSGKYRDGDDIGGIPVMPCLPENLEETINRFDGDMLAVCLERRDEARPFYAALRRVRFGGVDVRDWLTISEEYGGRVPLTHVDEVWLLQASLEPSIAVVRRFKRLLDLVVSVIGIIIFTPVALFIAAVIKAESPLGAILYKQSRVGHFGETFMMYKFRTMVEDAEGTNGPVWSPRNDSRITRVGRVLRRFRLDEIPQIINILKGDMSIVGPRPERPEFVAELEKRIPFYRERENIPPGLTGWAQIQFPYTDSVDEVARKLEYDLYYVKNMSIRLDLQVILRTIRIVMLGKEREV